MQNRIQNLIQNSIESSIYSRSGPSAGEYDIREPLSTDKYLDPAAGVDGTGTEASPWNVFTNAKVSTLVAGQILWIKNGTFNWATCSTLASGTAVNRIKIAAYPGHTPSATLSSSTVGFDSSYGFGATGAGCSYWDLYGLDFTLAGRAGIIFGASQWNNPELTISNVRIINCTGNTTLALSDNGGILFFDGNVDYWEVVGGAYRATGATGGSGTNRALIWADYQDHLKIIGVILNATNTSVPFYYKHTNSRTIDQVDRVFKNNICIGGSRGNLFCGRYFQITNNVFSGALVNFGDQGGGSVDRGYNTIEHNTFLNSTCGFTVGAVNGENWSNVLKDNVISGSGQLWDNPYAATDFLTESSFNAYDSGTNEIRRNNVVYGVTTYRTAFADREVSSVFGTISFAGAASESPTVWELAPGSTGENAASDGMDCGVNIANLLTTV